METPEFSPRFWTAETLLACGLDTIHELARTATGTLTCCRLILGRCMLALQERKLYKNFGCSGPVHYATEILGEPERAARASLRVADKLRWLPRLSRAAENGTINWSKLREIVRKATPETEEYWLELTQHYNCKQLQRLVSQTPQGAIPGEVEPAASDTKTKLHCSLDPGVFRLVEQARAALSAQKGEPVTTSQVLEWVLIDYLASQPMSEEVLEETRREADKDLAAERARQQPLVWEARELALEMGLLGPKEPVVEEGEPMEETLARAVGLTGLSGGSPMPRPSTVIHNGNPGIQSWENERLRFNPVARHTTPAQRRELLRRDGYCCQTPGCPNRLWLHIHHIQAYSDNGETVPENLVCLCSSCHRNVHDGTLIVTLQNDGLLLFTDQAGRRIDRVVDLEVAAWLDCWVGWSKEEWNSHSYRAFCGTWSATRDLEVSATHL